MPRCLLSPPDSAGTILWPPLRDLGFPYITLTQAWAWPPPWFSAGQAVRMTDDERTRGTKNDSEIQDLTWGRFLHTFSDSIPSHIPMTRNIHLLSKEVTWQFYNLRLGQVLARHRAKKISFLPLPSMLLPRDCSLLSDWPLRVVDRGEGVISFRGHPPLHGTNKVSSYSQCISNLYLVYS